MADKKTVEANLALWREVEHTPKQYTKPVTIGKDPKTARRYTTIDPYYRLRRATELWGPFGGRWGVRNERFDWPLEGEHLLVYQAELYYPADDGEGVVPLHSSIRAANKNGLDADAVKKVATDALTKGLSKLGFSADIFLGSFEDEPYVSSARDAAERAAEAAAAAPQHKEVYDLMKAYALATETKFETAFAKVTKGIEAGNRYKVLDIASGDLAEVRSRLEILCDEAGYSASQLLGSGD